MKVGYACINTSVGCSSSKTFRLKSYSEARLKDTINKNLTCLEQIIDYNVKKGLLFFRISSDIIPFASHPICKLNWQELYKDRLQKIGIFIKKNKMRISMHPDQFTILNALDQTIVERSKKELLYHTQFLDLLGLNQSEKIQIHVGGAYGNKEISIDRFITQYNSLDQSIKNRLLIENDERLFTVNNCLYISHLTGIPVLFDSFHHSILNNGESYHDALENCSKTWKKKDGPPMIDYSSQNPDGKTGNHAQHIDSNDFFRFLLQIRGIECDIMLEIKDKERSALKASGLVLKLQRKIQQQSD